MTENKKECDCIDGEVYEKDAQGCEFLYRCPCPKGDALSSELFPLRDKEHARPYRIPFARPKAVSGRDRAADPEIERD